MTEQGKDGKINRHGRGHKKRQKPENIRICGTFSVPPPSNRMRAMRSERKEGISMKKMIALILSAALLLGISSALAETEITVSGTGNIRISADTAVISLGVNARDRDVLKAQQKVNEAIASIRKALIEQGVKEENITTDFMNIYAIYDYRNDQEELSAYNANSSLAVKVTDMDIVGKLIDAAFAAGANTLNGISFSAANPEEAENEALREAVTEARKKAEILAEASGLKITGIESISEGSVFSHENTIGNVRAKGMDMMETEEDAGTVVSAAKLIVSATVSITFTAE